MTKDEIILANQECLFPAVFHYFREPLVLDAAPRISSCGTPMATSIWISSAAF